MSLDELRAAEAHLAACRQAHNRLQQLAAQIAVEQAECRRLRDRAADERADVRRLESMSVTSIVARARGKLDDRLRAEAAEAAQADLDLATQQAAVARLTAEFEASRDLAHDLDAAQARVDAAMAARAEQLAGDDTATAQQLDTLDAQLSAERAARAEIVEAHHAALGADGALEMAIRTMTSARNWSVHDTFVDGGWASSTVKQGYLGEAVERNAAVHASLIRLRAELGELASVVHHPNLSQPSVQLLAVDRWFDNQLSDYLAHRTISRSLAELERARECVRALLAQLGAEERIATERVAALEARRERVLRNG